MRADARKPELGSTGLDLTSLVPAGNGVKLRQEEREQAECHAGIEIRSKLSLLALESAGKDNTNKDLVYGKKLKSKKKKWVKNLRWI